MTRSERLAAARRRQAEETRCWAAGLDCADAHGEAMTYRVWLLDGGRS